MSFIDRVEKELMSRKLRKSDLAHGAGIPERRERVIKRIQET